MSRSLEALFGEARSVGLSAGRTLFRAAAPVSEMFLVASGRVHLRRHTVHGTELVLQRAVEGMVVAEASAYSSAYHCDAVAAVDSALQALPRTIFLAAMAENSDIAAQWAETLARSVQAARLGSEIRSLPKVADRLDAWLGEGNALPAKGRWQDVSNELGVTREALYRELARRRKGNARP